MTKAEVLAGLLSSKIVAVIRTPVPAAAVRAAEALRGGGVTAIEVTLTVPGAADVIRAMARGKGPGVLVGAGTVLDAAAASEVIAAGADFVVSPISDGDVIRTCREAGVLVAPGAFTPTEIMAAWRAGADIVKVFPATSLGPRFFRDLRGPLPQVRLMPTGGVTVENARDFLEAGACCVGIGTALLDRKDIEMGDWEAVTARAARLVGSLRGL
jgi:2-dehydro-3-deoxyphosphogluconate aldolase/(4S)-4-hydroxy-2-oxoglutarate aldolase